MRPASPVTSAHPSGPDRSIAASPPPGWKVYDSPRYGYTVSVPSDWRIEARPGTGGLHPGEPGIETFTGDNRLLGIAVVAVEDGQLLGTWRSPIGLHYEESDAEGHGVPALETRRTTVDGVEARITRYRLDLTPYTNDIMEVELIADGRGWMLTFLLLDGISDADEELLDEILASLRLPG